LVLVGPPGVGKTSLGKSIAKATGRPNSCACRLAACATRLKSAVTARATYIGSIPAKIIQSDEEAKTSNRRFCWTKSTRWAPISRRDPSIGADLRFSIPSRTILLPTTISMFGCDYDLSNVMFITTANTLNIRRR